MLVGGKRSLTRHFKGQLPECISETARSCSNKTRLQIENSAGRKLLSMLATILGLRCRHYRRQLQWQDWLAHQLAARHNRHEGDEARRHTVTPWYFGKLPILLPAPRTTDRDTPSASRNFRNIEPCWVYERFSDVAIDWRPRPQEQKKSWSWSWYAKPFLGFDQRILISVLMSKNFEVLVLIWRLKFWSWKKSVYITGTICQ